MASSTTTGDTVTGEFKELDFSQLTYVPGKTTVSYNKSTDVLTVTAGKYYESLTLQDPGTTSFAVKSDGSTGSEVAGVGAATVAIELQPAVMCYRAGTRILTSRGPVEIERLQIGDLVLTSSGEMRLVRWLGHRTIDCRRHPRATEVQPVRIAAHAFEHDVPSRDLYVSPAHAICVDVIGDVLIPAAALINGSTIAQVVVDEVAYWHVELDSHDILMAENLPAESYLDTGNRGFFAEGRVVDLTASPDAAIGAAYPTEGFCRPFMSDGLAVAAVRARLERRAATLVSSRQNPDSPEMPPALCA